MKTPSTESSKSMKKILLLIAGLTLAVFTSSCEWDAGGSGGSGGDKGGGSGPDDLDISNATTLDHNQVAAQNAAITRQLYSAEKSGGNVNLNFETLNWPRQGKVDGRCFMYWKDGAGNVIGGMWEYHATGRTDNDLVNIFGGYLGGKKPAPGTEIYFCLVNLKGNERTNVKKSVTPW
jgi:hypothetical protein